MGQGGDLAFEELRTSFTWLGSAFSNLRIVREQLIADGNFLAARKTFSGDFTDVFTHSPIGSVEPTGEDVEWEVINTFRYDGEGRLAEEWVQSDHRSFPGEARRDCDGICPQRVGTRAVTDPCP